MDTSLASCALLIKGYILNHRPPAEIMQAIDTIINGVSPAREEVLPSHILAGWNWSEPENTQQEDNYNKADDSLPSAPKEQSSKAKLKIADLPEVQHAHDNRESNVSIGKRYNVTDQTVINFLKKHGRYNPPLSNKNPIAPKQEVMHDNLGEPLINLPLPPPQKGNEPDLSPSDLVDIHDLLNAGKTLEDIAEIYVVPVNNLRRFVEKHRAVKITKCPYARGMIPNQHIVKPRPKH